MTELVEREREIAALAALLDAVPGGEGRVAWIEGPAGIGKSTLLADARRRAAGSGARVLAARGSELEREFPFGVVRQLFEGLVSDPEARERALAVAAASALLAFSARRREGRERALAAAAASAAAVFGAPDATAGEGDASFAALHGLLCASLNLACDCP